MAALSVGLLAGANGAVLRLALKRYFATVALCSSWLRRHQTKMPRSTGKIGEK
jgi:hypothetical protein